MAMPDDITTLICLFHDDDQAQAAYKDLQAAGFSSDSITVVGGKMTESQPSSAASLESIGVPQRDQKHLSEGLKDGGVLLAVEAFGPEQKKVEDIFTAHKAAKIDDQRTDEYENYKKYKPETQEHPLPVAGMTPSGSGAAGYGLTGTTGLTGTPDVSTMPGYGATGTTGMGANTVSTVEDGLLVDEESETAIPVRVVHVYRRETDL